MLKTTNTRGTRALIALKLQGVPVDLPVEVTTWGQRCFEKALGHSIMWLHSGGIEIDTCGADVAVALLYGALEGARVKDRISPKAWEQEDAANLIDEYPGGFVAILQDLVPLYNAFLPKANDFEHLPHAQAARAKHQGAEAPGADPLPQENGGTDS